MEAKEINVVRRGISKTTGRPYTMIVVDKCHQYNNIVIDMAIKAGVPVIDKTPVISDDE